MARSRKRKSYSEAKRNDILAAAQKEGLTAAQVKQKFGVTPVTYYSWRKKYALAGRRGGRRGAVRAGRGSDIQSQLRSEVQAKVREILPDIVRTEVSAYLGSLLGGRRRGRPRKV
jgi:transposase-like protein